LQVTRGASLASPAEKLPARELTAGSDRPSSSGWRTGNTGRFYGRETNKLRAGSGQQLSSQLSRQLSAARSSCQRSPGPWSIGSRL